MASDASETLVLDQCALFALRCAVGAAQDREVSSQEIIGALRTAAKWALAHRHDVHSREEGQLVLTALDTGECPPPSIGLMTQALQTLGCRLKTLDNTPGLLTTALSLPLCFDGSWQRLGMWAFPSLPKSLCFPLLLASLSLALMLEFSFFFWNLYRYWYRFGCSQAKYGAQPYGQHEGKQRHPPSALGNARAYP